MSSRGNILTIVKFVCIALLGIGFVVIAAAFVGSGYMLLFPIGAGIIAGSVLIFLIGSFFVATEEMLVKSGRG